jgi:uncharacterized protein
MQNTLLHLTDSLPLTCSRKGTCCHGNQALLNPWELHQLAFAKCLSPLEFRDKYCDWKGIRLKFDGMSDSRGKKSCNQYSSETGCTLHEARPLACRLFPLGRQIQLGKTDYVFQGNEFPCFKGCKEVKNLPFLTVQEYLIGQKTELYEQAQDAYLEIMQNIADIAFMLLLDTGLPESGDTKTLQAWKKMAYETPDQLLKRIDSVWIDYITIPPIHVQDANDLTFIQQHEQFLEQKAQEFIDSLKSFESISEAAIMMMAIALILAKSIGADTKSLIEMWVKTARNYGAN